MGPARAGDKMSNGLQSRITAARLRRHAAAASGTVAAMVTA